MNKHCICSDGTIDLMPRETGFHLDDFSGSIKAVKYYEIQKNGATDSYGYCYLIVNDERPCHTGNIGFYIKDRYRGNEYAVRACRLLFQTAEAIGMKTLFLAVNKDNKPSKRICEKLGGSYLGTIKPEEHGDYYTESSLEREIYEFIL